MSTRLSSNVFIRCTTYLMLAGLLAPFSGLRGQSCLPADTLGAVLLENVRSILTATDPDIAAMRDSLRISAMPSVDVSLVAVDSLCTRAIQAYEEWLGRSKPARRTYVIELAELYYVVADPHEKASGLIIMPFFTREWLYLELYLF